jgi:hypothetical protein
MTPRLAPALVLLLAATACSGDKDAATTALTTLFPDTDPTEAYGEAGTNLTPAATSGEPSTGAGETAGAATSDGSATTNATGDTGDTADTADTGDTAATGGSSTDAATSEPAPTDGPGVLPGETGLDASCRRYVECGGTYYADAQACVDASLGYWGECPSRREALDAFGACMSELACDTYDPDAYNPGDTPCADQWAALNESEPC